MSAKIRNKAISNIIKLKSAKSDLSTFGSVSQAFAEDVFTLARMKQDLSEETYKSLISTIREGKTLEIGVAKPVAQAMKNWAISRGATHYTHWFQPLTGSTAEKHDSFLNADRKGGIEMSFSGKTLIKGEPDASSFPSGGLRSTFEARGYTAWDPTSPAFIKRTKFGATLCIPTAFYSYTGDALDKKVPLLRSMQVVSKQVKRLLACFGKETKRVITTLGAEQEYFLVDKQLFFGRLDLVQCGRTLFGNVPAKHQQMEDHYFGSIKQRVLNFMTEVDIALWRLGIPVKTRHNEVAPSQFEIATDFEDLNLAVDHNMMIMETLREVAGRHGFVCLLHEKPFTGINGSGKHNNWSIEADGVNLLNPGKDPSSNAIFLTVLCAILKGVDQYAELLRATVATAGNEHRLGASEAPPAIVSIFLGEDLTNILDKIGVKTEEQIHQKSDFLVGVETLPSFPYDITDRNRTSPFAFTGNKFEFRAVGSEQTCSGPTVVLNLIFSKAIDEIATELEGVKKEEFNIKLQNILRTIVKNHKRVIFNGDNYSDEWVKMAKQRGLSNIVETPKALEHLIEEKTVALFEKYKVLSEAELTSRYLVYKDIYDKTKIIEGNLVMQMANTLFIPVSIRYLKLLLSTCNLQKKVGNCTGDDFICKKIKQIEGLINDAGKDIESLRQALSKEDITLVKKLCGKVRATIDTLEGIVDDQLWPVPKYGELLFIQ